MKTEHHDIRHESQGFIVKPNVINAFFPVFLKNLMYSVIFCAILFGIQEILNFFDVQILTKSWSIVFFIVLAIILAIIPLASKIFVLSKTRYIFQETNVVKEFRFIILQRKSVIYTNITNVSLKISIWDRLCGAGDITLVTADDSEPNLILQYVKHPEELEHKIYTLIKKQNSSVKGK